jgi:eukaryotic-like serine/threonine-protein kinase
MSLDNLGLVIGMQGRFDEALPLHVRSLAMMEASLGPDHPEVAASRSTLGNLYLEHGKFKLAYEQFKRALDDTERALGPDHHDLSFYLSGMGQSLMHMKNAREAVPVFERALKLRGDQANPNDTAEVSFWLARALWDAKGDRQRAIALAESARAAYKSLGHADVEDWLKTHRL